jgi:hypothetical protein
MLTQRYLICDACGLVDAAARDIAQQITRYGPAI